MATRNKRLKIVDDFKAGTITFSHEDGRVLTCRVSELNDDIRNIAIVKAVHNKVMDSYADAERFPDPMLPAMDIWQGLLEGNWNSGRGGEGAERTSLFVEAYAQYKQLEVAAVRKLVNEIEASEDEKRIATLKAARNDPRVKAIAEKIKMDRAREAQKQANQKAKEATGEVADLA